MTTTLTGRSVSRWKPKPPGSLLKRHLAMYEVEGRCYEILRGCPMIGRLLLREW
jgi:hypothetical protein